METSLGFVDFIGLLHCVISTKGTPDFANDGLKQGHLWLNEILYSPWREYE